MILKNNWIAASSFDILIHDFTRHNARNFRIIVERISSLTMNSIITSQQFLFRHAQRNATYIFDKAANQGRDDDIPADNESKGSEFFDNLHAIAGDGTAG